MKDIERIIELVRATERTGTPVDSIKLNNLLQDLLQHLPPAAHGTEQNRKELESIDWIIHETFDLPNEEIQKWHFYHNKHRMLQCAERIIRIAKTKQ